MSADDLISALFDGELNEQERAEVVRKLQEEPTAQRERDEIAHLSAALKGLPQAQAPAELRAQLRQRLERETLLGKPPAAAAIAPTSSAYRRRLFFAAAGLMTTTTAILLMVFIVEWKEDGARNQFAMDETSRPAAIELESSMSPFNEETNRASEADIVIASRDNRQAEQAQAQAVEGGAGGQARYSITNGISGSNPARNRTDGQPAAANMSKSMQAELKNAPLAAGKGPEQPDNGFGLQGLPPLSEERMTGERAIVGRSSTGNFNKDITKVPLGTVVTSRQRDGDQVNIVKMTVVDRFQFLNDFQVLLQRHEISNQEVVSVDKAGKDVNAADAIDQPAQASSSNQALQAVPVPSELSDVELMDEEETNDPQLFALYVSAPQEKMEAALKEMQEVATLVLEGEEQSQPLTALEFANNMNSIDVSNNGIPVEFYAYQSGGDGVESPSESAGNQPASEGEFLDSPTGNRARVSTKKQQPQSLGIPAIPKNQADQPRLVIANNDSQNDSKLVESEPSQSKEWFTGDMNGLAENGFQVVLTFPRSQLENVFGRPLPPASGEMFEKGVRRTRDKDDLARSGLSFKMSKGDNQELASERNTESRPQENSGQQGEAAATNPADAIESGVQDRAPAVSKPRPQLAQYLFILEAPAPKRKPVPAERPPGDDSSLFLPPGRDDKIPS